MGHSADAERIAHGSFKLWDADELERRRIEAGGTGDFEGLAIYSRSRRPVRDGTYIFVMDTCGNVFVDKHIPEEVYHSSLADGRWPIAAGEIEIRRGIIQVVNEASGHFAPDEGTASRVIAELGWQGFFTFENTMPELGFVKGEGKVPPYRVDADHTRQQVPGARDLRAKQRRGTATTTTAVLPPPRKPDGDGGAGGRSYMGPALGSGKFID